jgi:hypothetical protein
VLQRREAGGALRPPEIGPSPVTGGGGTGAADPEGEGVSSRPLPDLCRSIEDRFENSGCRPGGSCESLSRFLERVAFIRSLAIRSNRLITHVGEARNRFPLSRELL